MSTDLQGLESVEEAALCWCARRPKIRGQVGSVLEDTESGLLVRPSRAGEGGGLHQP